MMNVFKEKILNTCVRKGEFRTRSGSTVDTYFDKYQFEGNPVLLGELTGKLSELVPAETQMLAGLEMGGIPVATAISLSTKLPVAFVRKKAKPHGTMTISEGPNIKGKNVLIVEDVTTTGGQIILSAKDLADAGAKVIGVLLVIARDNKAIENLEKEGIKAIYYISPEEVNTFSSKM